jgi:molybdate transport system regulatory protein
MNIKSLRGSLGLSQPRLAQLLGVHAMTVSKWERGVLAPNPHQRRILRAFRSAAERGVRVGARSRRTDPVRFLSDLLLHAQGEPEHPIGALSATNRLPGTVVHVVRGDVVSKVVVEIAPGIRVAAVITTDSVDRLGLEAGARAIAIIKATEVILGGVSSHVENHPIDETADEEPDAPHVHRAGGALRRGVRVHADRRERSAAPQRGRSAPRRRKAEARAAGRDQRVRRG